MFNDFSIAAPVKDPSQPSDSEIENVTVEDAFVSNGCGIYILFCIAVTRNITACRYNIFSQYNFYIDIY